MKVESEGPAELVNRVTLGIAEAAVALGVSEAHLRNHLQDVPHFHLGGRVLFPVEGLHEWARRQAEAEQQRDRRDVDDIIRGLQK
jgi:hypothetical protein